MLPSRPRRYKPRGSAFRAFDGKGHRGGGSAMEHSNQGRLGRLRTWGCLGLLALTLLGGGCTSLRDYVYNGFKVGPNYKRPPAPVAPRWIDADDVRVRSQEIDDSHWWTVLNDPTLNDLVQIAYRRT